MFAVRNGLLMVPLGAFVLVWVVYSLFAGLALFQACGFLIVWVVIGVTWVFWCWFFFDAWACCRLWFDLDVFNFAGGVIV